MADFTVDVDSTGQFIVKDMSGTVIHTTTDLINAIQWAMNQMTGLSQVTVVENLGIRQVTASQPSAKGLSMLNFKDGMNLDLKAGLHLQQTNVATASLLYVDGRYTGDNTRNRIVIQGIGGRPILRGSGGSTAEPNEKGMYLRMISNLTIRNLEICNLANMAVCMDGDAGGGLPAYNNNNLFEDLFIHEWGKSIYASLGFQLDGSHNIMRRCVIDGMLAVNTRSAFYIGAETSPSFDNLIEDCDFLNSRNDNGVYLNSWGASGYVVHSNTFRRIHCAGHQLAGHSGFKCRPSSYNVIEDLLSELNHYGIDIGTGEAVIGFGDDGHGHLNDGWSRGNRFIRGVIRSNTTCGLVLTIDYDNTGVEQNYYDLYLFQNPIGIWFCNYAGGDGANGFIQDNIFFITIDTCSKDGMRLSAHNTVNAYSQRNHFRGVIKNCTEHAVLIDDLGVMDNYFDLVIINCGTNPISDGGTRNRWNGVGKYAYGVGVTPPSTEWNDGDIIVNTSDDTAWYKSAGIIQNLSDGQAIPQFTYMESKGGLPYGTVQFIDKSFVAGRTITAWLWNFGDGSAPSNLQHPTHDYATKGVYSVTLTVTDNLGNQTTVVQAVDVTEEGIIYRTLTIMPTSNGTTSPVAGDYPISDGQTAIVFFSPAIGYTFDHWELDGENIGLENPIHILMSKDHTLTAYSRLIPPEKGTLEVHSFLDDTEIIAEMEIVGIGSYVTPLTIDLDPNIYTLKCTYLEQTKTQTATIVAEQTMRVDFKFVSPTPLTSSLLIVAIPVAIIGGYFLLKGKR